MNAFFVGKGEPEESLLGNSPRPPPRPLFLPYLLDIPYKLQGQ